VVLSRPEGLQACSSVKQAQLLRARFDRIFKRASTGYATLDRLLRRLFRNKDGSCAFSNARRYRSTPTLPKTTSAPSSRKEKSPADRQRQGPRRARHHAGACQNLHEVEIVVLRIHRRPLGIPGPKIPPSQASSGQPRINPTSLAREFAPFTQQAPKALKFRHPGFERSALSHWRRIDGFWADLA